MLGEFLRGMRNVSNIYCRVLARSDIHCINLICSLRDKRQHCEKHASWSESDSERQRSRLGYETTAIKESRGPRCCCLISAVLLLAGSWAEAVPVGWSVACACEAACM